jgi:hypothetical protein
MARGYHSSVDKTAQFRSGGFCWRTKTSIIAAAMSQSGRLARAMLYRQTTVHQHFFDVIHGKAGPNCGPRLFLATGDPFCFAWLIDPVAVASGDRLTVLLGIPWKSSIFE